MSSRLEADHEFHLVLPVSKNRSEAFGWARSSTYSRDAGWVRRGSAHPSAGQWSGLRILSRQRVAIHFLAITSRSCVTMGMMKVRESLGLGFWTEVMTWSLPENTPFVPWAMVLARAG